MENDRDAITRVIQTYFDGLYEADAAKLESIFLPTSALAEVRDGKLSVTPRDTWLEAVRNRASAKSQGLERGDRILALEINGPTMAYVKVNCQLPPRFFTDQLSLLKVDGQWKVAQKVYQTTTR
ncbi:MAG TPA: nuclear transport factor 2 family protein [Hyphomicrobiaceae bacterium]|nr:nuclear transport factor 2 family protein [Hyphomicrobiaceae bacterium]